MTSPCHGELCYPQFTLGNLRLRQVKTQSHTSKWQKQLGPQACCIPSRGPHIPGGTFPTPPPQFLTLHPASPGQSPALTTSLPCSATLGFLCLQNKPRFPGSVKRKWVRAQGPPDPRTISCHPLPAPERQPGLSNGPSKQRASWHNIFLPQNVRRKGSLLVS